MMTIKRNEGYQFGVWTDEAMGSQNFNLQVTQYTGAIHSVTILNFSERGWSHTGVDDFVVIMERTSRGSSVFVSHFIADEDEIEDISRGYKEHSERLGLKLRESHLEYDLFHLPLFQKFLSDKATFGEVESNGSFNLTTEKVSEFLYELGVFVVHDSVKQDQSNPHIRERNDKLKRSIEETYAKAKKVNATKFITEREMNGHDGWPGVEPLEAPMTIEDKRTEKYGESWGSW